MLRKSLTLVVLGIALLIVPLMSACSSDPEPTPTSVPASDVSITGAWARPAAMITDEGDAMALDGMDMGDTATGDDSMAMGDDDDSMSDMGMDHDAMPMKGPAGGTGAVYFMLTNSGNADDTLVEVIDIHVEAPGDFSEMVELHETSMNDGVMKMQKLEVGIPVPAGESVELKPGGFHVMIMNIKRSLTPGDEVTLRLRFASGEIQTVVAEVREL
jgi:copper(I)-binding protein